MTRITFCPVFRCAWADPNVIDIRKCLVMYLLNSTVNLTSTVYCVEFGKIRILLIDLSLSLSLSTTKYK